MNKKLNRIALGAIVCAIGLLALPLAWGTAGAGISTQILAGPMKLDAIHTMTNNTDGHKVQVKTNGISDVYVVKNTITPGGHTGWHSHLGPSIISVVSGTATEYHTENLDGTVHEAGTAFLDDGNHTHIIRNEGDVDLVLIAFQILPDGATRRIDEPAPVE